MSRFSLALSAVAVLCVHATTARAQATSQPPSRLPATTIVGDNGKRVVVQNDRQSAVTLYVNVGAVDRSIGTVAAGATSSVSLPDWALKGPRVLKVVARVDRDAKAIASYDVPIDATRPVGLLIPPTNGLPSGDSIVVALPKGTSTSVTITVSNKRDRTVTVYAEQGLMFVKLGDVSANKDQTLVLPELMTKSKAAIRVFANSDGTAGISTQGIRVEQGDHIAVIVM